MYTHLAHTLPATGPSGLCLVRTWHADDHRFAMFSDTSRRLLATCKRRLDRTLTPHLSLRCTHVRGHGGAKAAVAFAHDMARARHFVARFDIRAYYERIDHRVLRAQLAQMGIDQPTRRLVHDYLNLPDTSATGTGMVAGGAISPLLGAVYLTPLDRAMEQLERGRRVGYRRFMDDYVIFAPTRHALRAAIRVMYRVLEQLKLHVHPHKRFIGKTTRGFDFLGYHVHPARRLRPAAQSLTRLLTRSRRLHEHGATQRRLRRYVMRWYCWLHQGLGARVSCGGGFTRIWVYVLKHLTITGYHLHPQ